MTHDMKAKPMKTLESRYLLIAKSSSPDFTECKTIQSQAGLFERWIMLSTELMIYSG